MTMQGTGRRRSGRLAAALMVAAIAATLILWVGLRYRSRYGVVRPPAESPAVGLPENVRKPVDSAEFGRPEMSEGDLRLLEAIRDNLLVLNDHVYSGCIVLCSFAPGEEWGFRAFDFPSGKSRMLCKGWVRLTDYSVLLVEGSEGKEGGGNTGAREAVFSPNFPGARVGGGGMIQETATIAIQQAFAATDWIHLPAHHRYIWLHDNGVGKKLTFHVICGSPNVKGLLFGTGDIDRESLSVWISPNLEF